MRKKGEHEDKLKEKKFIQIAEHDRHKLASH